MSLVKTLIKANAIGLAIAGSASAATYMQDFTFADGTTDLGDGSTIGSSVNDVPGTIASVQSNALVLTQVDTGGQRASYRIPSLVNSSQGWTATFDVAMADSVGGNPPADGFSFNYGDIQALTTNGAGPTGHGDAEGGMGGTVISFIVDTWQNGSADNFPGVEIRQSGVTLPGGRLDGIVLPNDGSLTATFGITWTPTEVSYNTNGLGTDADFDNLAHTFAGSDAYGWSFSGRTGGATSDVIIDNLNITTVPEPGGFALVALGLGSLVLRRRRA